MILTKESDVDNLYYWWYKRFNFWAPIKVQKDTARDSLHISLLMPIRHIETNPEDNSIVNNLKY